MEWLAPDFELELETLELNESDVQAKVEAIGCYKTQMSSFWPEVMAMGQEVRAGDEVPIESYWRVISR
jgi:hypothetical protein